MSNESQLTPIRRALLSVSDKTGLVGFASGLAGLGIELVSSGGTARTLREAGLDAIDVSEITGFPEIMDGRIKTLHPAVHAALLARRDEPEHLAALDQHGFAPIDLAVVNLYPFEKTAATPGVTRDELIEQIDIGGPTIIRAAAKNARWVTVVTDPARYTRVLDELAQHEGCTTATLRNGLAAEAFARTATYDRAIAAELAPELATEAGPPQTEHETPFAERVELRLVRRATPRYGENPHQAAAVYGLETPLQNPAKLSVGCASSPSIPLRPLGSETNSERGGLDVVNARQLAGKELSYNNLLDAAAAARLADDLSSLSESQAAACVVKHTNPCGAAIGPDLAGALDGAIAGDPLAAYGGIVALSRVVDDEVADTLADPERYFEVIAAPGFEDGAVEILVGRSKNLRLLEIPSLGSGEAGAETEWRSVPGGFLAQQTDRPRPDFSAWTHAAGPAPSELRLRTAAFLEPVARALFSNAIAIGGPDPERTGVIRLFGAGAGQMDRLAAARLAITKSGDLTRGATACSDAFFPFPDAASVLIDAGVDCLVHPGGSKRDEETFQLCTARVTTCLVTGTRRFRH